MTYVCAPAVFPSQLFHILTSNCYHYVPQMLPLYISLSTDQSQAQMCELMSQVNEMMDTDQYIIVGGLSSWSPSFL